MIDTQLWVLALRCRFYPRRSKDARLGEFARAFLAEKLGQARLLLPLPLLAEIFHVATRRGRYLLAPREVEAILDELVRRRDTVVVTPTRSTLREAWRLSSSSGIHIWDYLVVLPCRGRADAIFSADHHFQHPHFRAIAPVTNPLS